MKIFLAAVMAIVLWAISPALAHESREIAGKYKLVVGFVNEPAFAGHMNGVDLRVSALTDKKPIEGLEESLQVKVSKKDGKKSILLPLRARHKDPGRYAGYFLPAQPGDYVFVIEGVIDGTPINERFVTGDGKVHSVETPVRFP